MHQLTHRPSKPAQNLDALVLPIGTSNPSFLPKNPRHCLTMPHFAALDASMVRRFSEDDVQVTDRNHFTYTSISKPMRSKAFSTLNHEAALPFAGSEAQIEQLHMTTIR